MRKDKKADERPKVSLLKVIMFGLKVNMSALPALYIGINIVSVFHGVSHGFATFMTQKFYDSVESVITGKGPLKYAFLMILALGATYIVKEVLNGVHNFMHDVVFTKLNGEMAKIIHGKMARIDPVCLEDTKLHDDINKAQEGAWTVSVILNIGITIFTFYIPYFAFMGIYLYYLKPQFILTIVLVFIPVLAGQLMRTGIIAKFEDKAAPIRREYEYYEKAIVDREYFKETRILGAFRFFVTRFLNSLGRLGKAEWEANRKTNLIELGMRGFTVLGYCGILYMLVKALLAGEISVGAFAAVFGSIGMLFAVMEEIIARHIGHIASNLGKAHNLIRFMELPERGGTESDPDFSAGIVVENVSFTYPNAECKSVDNVSFEIKAGETVAVVGENGAGKTTLVRLLLGLYKPTEGVVRVNGMDTSKVSNRSLFRNASGVFQKYQRYQMSLEENIRISEMTNSSDVRTAAEQAGVEVDSASFPDGYSTMLSREFDGVDLSIGQWQRIAIARGLYRVHNIIVLDEPTAAIDPIEESRVYKKFVDISKGKTAIIVTHRLGSTKIADRVIIMDKGKVAAIGSHDELMRECKLYRTMYNSQAEWYADKPMNNGADAITATG
ncbi:MAG: ABC transporter ATP-binding protein [Clostridiaceae bacterium]|nr:ABC transporter ATP-binding protein [Clostridiaceae bacterium]